MQQLDNYINRTSLGKTPVLDIISSKGLAFLDQIEQHTINLEADLLSLETATVP